MSRWTVGRRIVGGYVVLLALLAITAGVGIYALLDSRSTYRAALATQTNRATRGVATMQGVDATVVSFLHFLQTGDRAVLDTLDERFVAARKLAVDLREGSTTPHQSADWARGVGLLDDWKAAIQTAIDAKRAGHEREATRIYTEQVLPIRQQTRDLIETLVEAERGLSARQAKSASDTASRSIWLLIGVSVLALIGGLLIALLIARGITTRLRGVINRLSSASAEIVAATSQQASGAAESQAAVHQTTATVDEVRQTVQLTTEKAHAVARSVQETANVSRDGRQAVDESISGTREAKVRMEVLAERILALSEQAQTIGDIVMTVNGLAEQSNLLAVNAGIEAAKAGDAGRGFAVVASEVKLLAEQSKRATERIREILNEIQRATQAAVLATEQGVKASETGEAVSSQAGDAIRALADNLSQSAQAAQQILASSQQQMTGMDQVVLAMQSIQEGSTQNMASTRQVEQAAQDLDELARRLSELVAGADNGRHATLAAV